jgi:hypothetical protein
VGIPSIQDADRETSARILMALWSKMDAAHALQIAYTEHRSVDVLLKRWRTAYDETPACIVDPPLAPVQGVAFRDPGDSTEEGHIQIEGVRIHQHECKMIRAALDEDLLHADGRNRLQLMTGPFRKSVQVVRGTDGAWYGRSTQGPRILQAASPWSMVITADGDAVIPSWIWQREHDEHKELSSQAAEEGIPWQGMVELLTTMRKDRDPLSDTWRCRAWIPHTTPEDDAGPLDTHRRIIEVHITAPVHQDMPRQWKRGIRLKVQGRWSEGLIPVMVSEKTSLMLIDGTEAALDVPESVPEPLSS